MGFGAGEGGGLGFGEGTGEGTCDEDEGVEGVGNVLAEDACNFANRFMRIWGEPVSDTICTSLRCVRGPHHRLGWSTVDLNS